MISWLFSSILKNRLRFREGHARVGGGARDSLPTPGAHPSTQVSKPTAWPFSLHLALASHTCEKQGSGAARWRPE